MDHDDEPFDELTSSVLENAHGRATLPNSGIAPRDYPAGANIAAVERAAGRAPLERITTAASSDHAPEPGSPAES